MRCEHLFCNNEAVARLTAPRLQPRHMVCEECLERTLAWAEPYRSIPGRVIVEQLSAS